jgi:hypothetical protein
MAYAVSTLFICEALLESAGQDVGHVAIDPYQNSRFARCGLQLIDEAGAGVVVEFHPVESPLVLPRLLDERPSSVLPSSMTISCLPFPVRFRSQ